MLAPPPLLLTTHIIDEEALSCQPCKQFSTGYDKMADLIQTPQTNTEKFVSRTAVAGRHEGGVADSEG